MFFLVALSFSIFMGASSNSNSSITEKASLNKYEKKLFKKGEEIIQWKKKKKKKKKKKDKKSGGGLPYYEGVAGYKVALELYTLQLSLDGANETARNAKRAIASVVVNKDQKEKIKALKDQIAQTNDPEKKATLVRQYDDGLTQAINDGANENKKLTQEQIQLVITATGNLAFVVGLDNVALETAKGMPDGIKGAIDECNNTIKSKTAEVKSLTKKMKSNPMKAGKIGKELKGINKELKGIKMNLTFLTAAASNTVPKMPGDIAGQINSIVNIVGSVAKLAKGNSFKAPSLENAPSSATDIDIGDDI